MFDVSYTEISLVVSIMMIGIALTLIPGGYFSDRLGVKRSLTLSLALSMPLHILIILSQGFFLLLVLRLLLGLTCGLIFATSASYVTAFSPAEKVAKFQGVLGGFFGFGGGLGFALTLIVLPWSWRAAHLFPLLLLIVTLLPLVLWGEESHIARRMTLKELRSIANRRTLALGAVQFSSFGLYLTVGTWITSRLVQRQDLSLSLLLGGVIVLMNGLARIAGGAVSRTSGGSYLTAVSLVASTLLLVGLSLTDATLAVFALGLSLVWAASLPFGPVNELAVADTPYVGTSLGTVLFSGVLGAMILPTFFGYLLDVASFEVGFAVLALVTLATLIPFVLQYGWSQGERY